MRKLTVLKIIITSIFMIGMIVMSVIARPVHNKMIPNVEVFKLERMFVTSDNTTMSRLMMDKEFAETSLFVIYEDYVNCEKRQFVKSVTIETGVEHEGFIEVVSGIYSNEQIVLSSNRQLHDGQEVFVTNI